MSFNSIVQFDRPYDYDALCTDLKSLRITYPLIHTEVIGSSVMGKPIHAIRVGHGNEVQLHYNGAFHANEWITALLLMKFVEECARALYDNKGHQNNVETKGINIDNRETELTTDNAGEHNPGQIVGRAEGNLDITDNSVDFSAGILKANSSVNSSVNAFDRLLKESLQRVSLWVVPMINPDGVDLAIHGIHADHPRYWQLKHWNHGSELFDHWKANIRGVDLNDQFPAHWDEEVRRREVAGPGPRDYPGIKPLTEPEAKALAEFTQRMNFDAVFAFHTQGEEIYWNYRGYEPPESMLLAEHLAHSCDYTAIELTGSDAGYKDWYIQEFRRPGFTIEVGYGENPLPLEDAPAIYQRIQPLLLKGLELFR